MNNFKFNEEQENKGVVRKGVTDILHDHKNAFKGIITGIVVLGMIVVTAASNYSGPTGGATEPMPVRLDFDIVTSVTSYTTITTSTTTTSLTTTTSRETTEATTTVSENHQDPVTNTESNVIEETSVEVGTYNDEPTYTDEYIVYKPSTHYVHKNTCRWFDSSCQEITSTEGFESRKCSECNPDIEIISQYVEPEPQLPEVTGGAALDYVTELEYIYLCNTVGHEYGSNWVSLYDKACVVAVVMNRVRDGGWSDGRESTIYNVLTAQYQFNPSYATNYYHACVTQSCKDAVDYYFANQSIFPHYTSFWGDGRVNHFS